MTRKEDLVHLFNARGHAFLTLDYQLDRIRELERENTQLKTLVLESKRLLEEAGRQLRQYREMEKSGFGALPN